MRNINLESGKSIRINTPAGVVQINSYDSFVRVQTYKPWGKDNDKKYFFQVRPQELSDHVGTEYTSKSTIISDASEYTVLLRAVGSITIRESDLHPTLKQLFDEELGRAK